MTIFKAVRYVEPSTDDFSRILIPKNSSVTDSPCNFLRGVNDVYHIVFGVWSDPIFGKIIIELWETGTLNLKITINRQTNLNRL